VDIDSLPLREVSSRSLHINGFLFPSFRRIDNFLSPLHPASAIEFGGDTTVKRNLYILFGGQNHVSSPALAGKQEQPGVYGSHRNKQNDLTSCFGTFRGIVKTKHFPFDRVRRARFPGWPLPFRLHSYPSRNPGENIIRNVVRSWRERGERLPHGNSRTFSWLS
jgi:hypothetical protein